MGEIILVVTVLVFVAGMGIVLKGAIDNANGTDVSKHSSKKS
jgi:hypothetical protein